MSDKVQAAIDKREKARVKAAKKDDTKKDEG
jgi:hypothetical protein